MAYFGKPVAVRDVIVRCVRHLLRYAAAWIDQIDFSTLEQKRPQASFLATITFRKLSSSQKRRERPKPLP